MPEPIPVTTDPVLMTMEAIPMTTVAVPMTTEAVPMAAVASAAAAPPGPGVVEYAPGTVVPVNYVGGGAWRGFDVGPRSSAWHLPGGVPPEAAGALFAAWRGRRGWEQKVVRGKPQPRHTMFFDRAGRAYPYGGCVVR